MTHQLSYIHPESKIGKDVNIDPFVHIHKNVEIGEGTWIGSNATIMPGARIGKNCKIFPNAVISAIPQDLKFGGEDSLAIIGDNTTIRESVTINRGTKFSGETKIGANCLIMAYVHVAHDCIIGNNAILVNGVQVAGHVNIGQNSIIGGLSAIHQFVTIGKYAMISGGSLIRKDVPPFIKAGREPLSFIGVNSIGLNRNGFSKEKIDKIQDTYREIFQNGKNYTQAIELLKKENNKITELEEIIQFIENSSRGLIKNYSKR